MRRNLFVLAALIASAALFLPPVLEAQSQRASRLKCSNNLRQIGLAQIQYADDKRFYPHVGPIRQLDGGVESNHTAVKLRALVYYGYHDNPEGWICPSSDDYAPKIKDNEILENMRKWHWNRGSNANPRTAPWLDSADDPKGSESHEFSYGLTRRGHNSNTRSTTVLAADRAVRDGVTTGALAGNHDAGWNVLKADGTVEFVPYTEQEAKQLVSTERGGSYLAIKDQSDGSRFKPLSKNPPAAAAWRGWYKGLDGSTFKLVPTEWSSRSQSWGFRGTVKLGSGTYPVIGRTAGKSLKGRIDGPSGVMTFTGTPDGKGMTLETEGRTLSLNRIDAPPPPLDRKLRNMVAVGLVVALRTRNLDAARGFMTEAARKRISTASLKQLSEEIAGVKDRELRTYINKWEDLVVAGKDGVGRVNMGGVVAKGPDAPKPPRARILGNEATAIGALKTISVAQTLFREGDKERDGILDYAQGLGELGATHLIDKVLASGKKQGYRFVVCHSSTAPEFLWMAVASPLDSSKGMRHFAVNHEGVVFHSKTPFELDSARCKIKGGKPVGR
ncbi:MAG: DUF1559 domain-containing protein [Planctomycetes bacterium]|nr:DUF1559 domain-containing protein [Planctomycetota bacterium]